MFSNKKTNQETEVKAGSINLIGLGTEITGDIITKGDIRIDGRLTGDLSSKARIVIGASGQAEGNITCQTGEISGLVTGNVSAAEILFLKATARIKGDISAAKLVVENGAVFAGHCHIGSMNQPAIKDAATQPGSAGRIQQRQEIVK